MQRFLLLCCLCGLSALALAHESRPLYLEVTELQTDTYKLQWRIPASVQAFNLPEIRFPDTCTALNAPRGRGDLSGDRIGLALYRCQQPLANQTVTVHYPDYNPSISSLIKYRNLNGEQHTQLLGPQELQWQVPDRETTAGVARDYTLLGIEHIWAGIDHLLFIVCLLWIAGSLRRVLITITGFTVAHSLTLALSALELVRLPVPPVEATIALSIVFLASEIAKGARHNLTWRYPIAVSSSFGLLHGFGFAAALSEVGLPQTEIVTGLLFFNVGVEIGQVIFAAAAIAAAVLARRLFLKLRPEGRIATPLVMQRSQITVSYAVGSVASFWLIQRCMGF